MKRVDVKYRLFSWLPFTRNAHGNFPQNWGDVTPKQLVSVSCLYRNCIAPDDFLASMSGISKRIIQKLDDYQHFKLMELIRFIGDNRPYHEFIIRKLEVKPWKIKPVAPAGKLKGITFGQFMFADTYFTTYIQSQKEEDLNRFVATLYLCEHEQFNEWIPDQRHAIIGRVDRNIREAIVINYQLIHEWLSAVYPLIFQKYDEETVAEKQVKEAPKPDPNTWVKVFNNFVGDDIIHSDVWANQPINTIFTYMTRKYKENARRGNNKKTR